MEPLVFSMAGNPRGKGRPRATARGGFARVYTDEKTRAYEKSVRTLAKQAMGWRKPIEGALSVSIRFRFEPAKSLPKYRKARLLSGEEAFTSGPDLDNLAKSILDGMNEVVFLDDSQIVRLWLTKVASERPGVDVRIEALAPEIEAAA